MEGGAEGLQAANAHAGFVHLVRQYGSDVGISAHVAFGGSLDPRSAGAKHLCTPKTAVRQVTDLPKACTATVY